MAYVLQRGMGQSSSPAVPWRWIIAAGGAVALWYVLNKPRSKTDVELDTDEEADAAGLWYVYDKGVDDPVVYKVKAPTRAAAMATVQRKLHRKRGAGLRIGPWSHWSAGDEPIIPLG